MTEPAITIRAYHSSSGSNEPVTRLVIHATCPPNMPYSQASATGQAASTARYFQDPNSGGSAHYIMDLGSEEHCVPENVIAWHAPPNAGSIGFEICGEDFYTRDQWLSAEVWPAVQRTAIRVREVANRRSIPLTKLSVSGLQQNPNAKGICGHVDVSAAFHQSDHTDPGPNFPWDRFMAEVSAQTGVKPMFDPPQILRPIVASCKTPNGGVALLADDGSIYTYEGAPWYGTPQGKPWWGNRRGAWISYRPPHSSGAPPSGEPGYTVKATSGEVYNSPFV